MIGSTLGSGLNQRLQNGPDGMQRVAAAPTLASNRLSRCSTYLTAHWMLHRLWDSLRKLVPHFHFHSIRLQHSRRRHLHLLHCTSKPRRVDKKGHLLPLPKYPVPPSIGSVKQRMLDYLWTERSQCERDSLQEFTKPFLPRLPLHGLLSFRHVSCDFFSPSLIIQLDHSQNG